MFISILYMFQAAMCPSSGELLYNQLDAQFFMYVYFYSLHVSGSHVPVIRRIIVSMQHLVYVTV